MIRAKNFTLFLALMTFFLISILLARPAEAAGDVVVNGQPLSQQDIRSLATLVGEVRPGRYWYDPYSGLWGYEGGPSVGQITSGLQAPSLAPNISGSGTGTFINGRELHPVEMQRIVEAYGYVLPGRFWMNARFQAGYEGGPMQFDMSRTAGGGCGSVSSHENSAGRTSMMTGFGCDGCIDVATAGAHWSNC